MGTILLYRAVSLGEFEDLFSSGRFRPFAGSLEGKWFAESARDAQAWGRLLYGKSTFRVVSTAFPDWLAASFFRLDRLDNIGPARFADFDQLSSALFSQACDE